ncbi:MAG TPA: hypothetical protein PKA02_02830 [Candidatus Saccharibacteria bacterium]|nr:hypothetical protein [Candidatus Saccharibacteria bacterium]
MPPQAPNQTSAMPEMQKPKVILNPFKHLVSGAKNMFATNALVALLTMVIASVFYFVVLFGFSLLLATVISDYLDRGSFPVIRFVAGAVALLTVLIVAASIINQIVMRTVVTGSRRQKVTIKEAFTLVLGRIGLSILTFLIIFGAIFGVELFVILTAFLKVPVLTALLAIAAAVLIIKAVLNLSFIAFVLVDDEKPNGAVAAMKQSSHLWKRSRGALLMYWLLWFVISIVFSMLTGFGSYKANTSTTYSTKATTYTTPQTYNSSEEITIDANDTSPDWVLPPPSPDRDVKRETITTMSVASMLLTSVLSGLFSIVLFSGLGKIYNDAKILEGLPGQQLAGGSPPKVAEHTPLVSTTEPQLQATPPTATPLAPEPGSIEQPPADQLKDQ